MGKSIQHAREVMQREDRFLVALANHSLGLLSGNDIDEILVELLTELLDANVEAAAFLDVRRNRSQRYNWRLRHLQFDEESLGSELRQKLAARMRASLEGYDFELFRLDVTLTARISDVDSSVAMAPAFHGSVLSGLLWVRTMDGAWEREALAALGKIAACLGQALENRANLTAFRERLAQQEMLVEAGMTVSSSLDLTTVLNRLAEQMAEAVDATSAHLLEWSAEREEARVAAIYVSDRANEVEAAPAVGTTYSIGESLRRRMPFLVDGQIGILQVHDTEIPEPLRRFMERLGGKSVLVVPFMVQGRTVGFAALWESRHERVFRASEVEIIKGMARQGAIAFENAQLYEQVRQRINELELVHQVAVATARLVDIDRLLAETTSFVVERIYPDVFGFLLRDAEGGEFRPHSSYHGLPDHGLRTAVPMENSISGQVVRTAKPVIVNDVSKEALYFSIVPETRSEIAVPMISEGKVIGVINVESRKRNAFSETDLRFLLTLAGQVATAIERVRLYADLEKHADHLAEEVDRRTLELQWERDRMLAILDSAGEGIMFTDVDARILYVNPALEAQTGYTRSECLGSRPSLWRSAETPEAVFEEMWGTLLSGKRWRGEVVNRRKDGSKFDAVLTITPLNDADGHLSGFVGVQADISRLKEVDRLKSKFIANVSHELRTPLTNIRNYISLLERGDARRRLKYMGVIRHESDRLTRLIQDLLDLSRLEANARAEDIDRINIAEFVESVTVAFAAQADRRKIVLDCFASADLPDVEASPSEMQQVLNNLVGNALAYTPSGGRVRVSAGSAELEGQCMVWMRVEDNGPGIRPEEMPRLFERFYRGEAARRNGAPGTGLGLAICKEILDFYGGKLELDSVPGEGTLFTVWMPGVVGSEAS